MRLDTLKSVLSLKANPGGTVNRKVLSLGVVLVALLGSLLVAFIPTASASRTAHDAACSYTTTNVPCTTQITAGPGVQVGTVLDPGVTVTGNSNGSLTIDDHGKTVSLPRGETIEIASDGTYVVLSTKGPYGRGAITVINGKIKTIYLHPSLGITFGANHTAPTILRYVSYYTGTSRVKVSSRVYNRPHGQLFSVLKTPNARTTVSINSGILEYTRAEIRFIRAHHAKKASVVMAVRTTAGKLYAFKILTPIGKLRVETFLTK
jgi:hypothetical protein